MVQKTILLTLGRLPKALELARGFSALGYRVIVAEPHAWHVLRLSRHVTKSIRLPAPNSNPDGYRRALRRAVRQEAVCLVLPVSEEAPHVLEALADESGVTVFSPTQREVETLQDKLAFAHNAQTDGLSVPETALSGTDEAHAIAASGPTVTKPVHGCSGQGVAFHDQGAEIRVPADHLVQRRIDGRHISTFSLVHNGRVCATALYEGTLMLGTVAVCFRRVTTAPAIDDWIARFTATRPLSGFLSFDFIVDADGTPWAIECNPRTTSGIHFLEPASLAQAVLDKSSDVTFRSHAHFQQFFPALTEAYSHILSPRRFVGKLKTVFSARDVIFDWRDLKPFFLMTPASWPILRQTIFGGKSLGEAATQDIVWTPRDTNNQWRTRHLD
ncbi:MAG: ATP-grasp domain-containing protein [Pseudomonadota bacterium]